MSFEDNEKYEWKRGTDIINLDNYFHLRITREWYVKNFMINVNKIIDRLINTNRSLKNVTIDK